MPRCSSNNSWKNKQESRNSDKTSKSLLQDHDGATEYKASKNLYGIDTYVTAVDELAPARISFALTIAREDAD